MDNWKEIIKNRIEEHQRKIEQVNKVIEPLLSEIQKSPYNIDVEVSLEMRGDNPIWRVTIHKKQSDFSLKELFTKQEELDWGEIVIGEIGTDQELKENIISLILEKFKW